jgi:dihydroorotate dehydrogenase electron transfer subunit
MSNSEHPDVTPGTVAATVVENVEVAPRHYQLRLLAPEIARQARAGHFVHVLCREEIGRDPLLRRAFSIMSTSGDEIEVLYRIEGRGTAWLSDIRVGVQINVLGPLGIPFDVEPVTTGVAMNVALVGGGVGVPPMVALGNLLRQETSAVVSAFVGARTASDLIGLDDFLKLGILTTVTTDDGSTGHHGRITEPLEEWLKVSRETVVYACGPLPMLRAVALLCARYEVRCQVSLEENMPCGIGICNGCVVKTLQPAAVTGSQQVGDEWSPYENYRRICIEGPAVWANEIDWEVA